MTYRYFFSSIVSRRSTLIMVAASILAIGLGGERAWGVPGVGVAKVDPVFPGGAVSALNPVNVASKPSAPPAKQWECNGKSCRLVPKNGSTTHGNKAGEEQDQSQCSNGQCNNGGGSCGSGGGSCGSGGGGGGLGGGGGGLGGMGAGMLGGMLGGLLGGALGGGNANPSPVPTLAALPSLIPTPAPTMTPTPTMTQHQPRRTRFNMGEL